MENKMPCPCPMCMDKAWCNIYHANHCPAYLDWMKSGEKKEKKDDGTVS